MCVEKPSQPDLDQYLEIIRRLHQCSSVAEHKSLIQSLVKLLRSNSVSVRRSAKYELRVLLGYRYKALRQWSPWGPPVEEETRWWEKKFRK